MSHWSFDAIFYHIYPLGLTGAPERNDFSLPPVARLEQLHAWIPHLQALGVNALYLGPLFESTAHGYDTADYYHVDRRLGTDQTLSELSAALHAGGTRLVLDAVFNHVGRDFWAFRDVQANGGHSPYRDWFHNLRFEGRSPYGDPFTYEGWAGHTSLVKLNLANPAVREHLFGAVASWMEAFGIDGLRLDAADVIDADFLREADSQRGDQDGRRVVAHDLGNDRREGVDDNEEDQGSEAARDHAEEPDDQIGRASDAREIGNFKRQGAVNQVADIVQPADVVADDDLTLLQVPAATLRALMLDPALGQLVLAKMAERGQIRGGLLDGLKDAIFGTTGPRGGRYPGLAEKAASSAVRSMGSAVGRELFRGVLGSLLGGTKRR